MHRRACAADLYGKLCWIAAETVAEDLHLSAARNRGGVWENLQNLRAVAKGISSDCNPAVLEKRRDVNRAVHGAGRRVPLDLSGARKTEVRSGLSAEVQLHGRREVLAGKDDGSSANDRALRWLQAWRCGHDRNRQGERSRCGSVDKADAAIGKAEEKLSFVTFLDFRGDPLDCGVGDTADELGALAVENGNERGSERRLAEIQTLSIA